MGMPGTSVGMQIIWEEMKKNAGNQVSNPANQGRNLVEAVEMI